MTKIKDRFNLSFYVILFKKKGEITMRYNTVKNANQILEKSSYLIKKPENYKNKWKD